MKFTLEKRVRLKKLGYKASDLLIEIYDESLPKKRGPTKKDLKFKKVLCEIHKIFSPLSDAYVEMYNHIQKKKVSKKDSYCKILRKEKDKYNLN